MEVPVVKQRGPRQRQVCVRIPRDRWYWLKRIADRIGCSVEDLVRSILVGDPIQDYSVFWDVRFGLNDCSISIRMEADHE